MNEQNLKIAVACLFVLVVSVFFNIFVMTDRVSERVIQRLKREYVPGPYEPGFDPDKVPPGSIKAILN